jgi:hypothetical protein
VQTNVCPFVFACILFETFMEQLMYAGPQPVYFK